MSLISESPLASLKTKINRSNNNRRLILRSRYASLRWTLVLLKNFNSCQLTFFPKTSWNKCYLAQTMLKRHTSTQLTFGCAWNCLMQKELALQLRIVNLSSSLSVLLSLPLIKIKAEQFSQRSTTLTYAKAQVNGFSKSQKQPKTYSVWSLLVRLTRRKTNSKIRHRL